MNDYSFNVTNTINNNLPLYIANSVNPRVTKSKNCISYSVYPSTSNNTYTTSQDIHYKAYPFDELKIYFQKRSYLIVSAIVSLMTRWLNLDAVYVNNLLVSTNLYEDEFYDLIQKETFEEVIPYQKAIIVRNILRNDTRIFENMGFKRIISRRVNILKTTDTLTKNQKKQINSDGNKLKELLKNKLVIKAYRVVPNFAHVQVANIEDVPFTKLRDLYKQLYHDKYSKYNPDFTEEWIKLFASSLNTGLIWIESNNIPIGVAGYYYTNSVLTTPLFGYDTNFSFESNYSLYRALSYIVHTEAKRLNKIEHRSGGCSHFKKQRGTKGENEYIMVKYNHLSFSKRFSWIYLHVLTIGLEFVQKQFENFHYYLFFYKK
jgi:hypothetical protein